MIIEETQAVCVSLVIRNAVGAIASFALVAFTFDFI